MSWITSRHAIEAALRRGTPAVLYLTDTHGRNYELSRLARVAGVDVRTVSAGWIRSNAGTSARGAALQLAENSGARSVVVLKDWLRETVPGDPGPILALDHITDPHNVGAILRSAYLFGAALVVVPARRSVLDTDVVRRSSAGAADAVPVAIVANLSSALRDCKAAGWWVYVGDADGTSLPQVRFDAAAVLVLGAEGAGISRNIRVIADMAITIPDAAPPDSTVDSFNVSVATGILLYEYHRQIRV